MTPLGPLRSRSDCLVFFSFDCVFFGAVGLMVSICLFTHFLPMRASRVCMCVCERISTLSECRNGRVRPFRAVTHTEHNLFLLSAASNMVSVSTFNIWNGKAAAAAAVAAGKQLLHYDMFTQHAIAAHRGEWCKMQAMHITSNKEKSRFRSHINGNRYSHGVDQSMLMRSVWLSQQDENSKIPNPTDSVSNERT